MNRKIGFTGTQRGMTTLQRAKVDWILAIYATAGATTFHHGDCVGADAEAHSLARSRGYAVVVHPPTNPAKRANLVGDATRPAKAYLDRNRDIVDATDVLVAAPGEEEEKLRSGTWSTIRYARKVGRLIATVYPSGVVNLELWSGGVKLNG